MYVYVSPGKQKVSRVVWMKYAFLWQNLQSVQLGRVWSCPESGRTLDVGQGVKQQGQHRLVPILRVFSTDDPPETLPNAESPTVIICMAVHGLGFHHDDSDTLISTVL